MRPLEESLRNLSDCERNYIVSRCTRKRREDVQRAREKGSGEKEDFTSGLQGLSLQWETSDAKDERDQIASSRSTRWH